MKVFSADYLNEITAQAQSSPRRRQHSNIHDSYADPCQRLFNAIEPESYIRPHRHASDPRDELLIAIRGSMALVTFDERGTVDKVVPFSASKSVDNVAIGIEIHPNTWHTVIAFESSSILLEVKAGPFDPCQPKDQAPWAPDEGSSEALAYLRELKCLVDIF